MAGRKQEDAEQRERELRLKELMREIRQLRLQMEREASDDVPSDPIDPESEDV